MTMPTDRDLILQARRGEREAFGELVTRYQTSAFNSCYRILHERGEAEDLAQETFIRAYDRIHTFDIEREFGPWMFRAFKLLAKFKGLRGGALDFFGKTEERRM